MADLIRFFWQLALLRRGPQDLPDSLFLLQVLLVLNLGLSFVLGLQVFASPLDVLGASVLELLLSALLLFVGLRLRGTANRWRQSYSALLGIGLIASVITLAYRSLADFLGAPEVAGLLDLLVFLWLLTAMAHVLRHSFDIPLMLALVIVFLYTMALFGLLTQWFPPDLPATQP
jgi:hypothetical protein